MTPPLPLLLRSVHVRRCYGTAFDDLRLDGLSNGITVVYAPNGRGKSTLARAVAALLLGTDVSDPELEAEVLLGEEAMLLSRLGRAVTVRTPGGQRRREALPGAAHPHAYHLALEDLIGTSRSDSFADLLRRQAQGGFSVDEAARRLDFSDVRTPRSSKATATAADAERWCQKVQAGHVALAQRALARQRLVQTLEAAEAARLEADAARQGLRLWEMKRRVEAVRATLSAFPPALAQLEARDAEALDTLRTRAREARRLAYAAEALALAFVAEPRFLEPDLVPRLDEGEEALDGLARCEHEATTAAARAAEAAAQALAARVYLPTSAADALADDRAVTEAVRHAERLQGLAARVASLEAELGALPPAEGLPEEPAAEARAAEALRAYLRAPAAAPALQGLAAALVAGLAALVALVGLHAPLPAGLAAGLALLAVTMLVLLRRRPTNHAPRAAARAAGVPEAELASPEAAARHLAGLEARLAHDAAARQAHAVLQARRGDLARRLAQARTACDEAHASLACDGWPLTPAEVQLRASALVEARRTEGVARGAEAQAALAEDAAEKARQRAADALASLGEPFSSVEAGRRSLQALRQALATHREALLGAEASRKEAAVHAAAAEDADAAAAALLARVGCSSEEELRALASNRPRFLEALKEYEQARGAYDGERAARSLASDEPLPPEDALRLRLAHATAQAEERDAARDALQDLDREVAEALGGRTLETAQADALAARAALLEEFSGLAARAIGEAVAAHVDRTAREATLPPVLVRARELLQTITHGRYWLELDDDAPFAARDTLSGRRLSLSALSTGTRIQLLLAVRLAFVEHQEQGVAFPLLLDETLATSDAARGAAIVEAITSLAATGRQVLYFTARAEEVALWKAYPGATVLCLAEPVPAHTPEALPARLPVPPAPLPGEPYDTYVARLGVPRWDARQPVSGLHPAYLLETPEDLFAVLSRGLRSWGALSAHLDMNLPTGLSPLGAQRAAALAHALEGWRDAWSAGRPLPLSNSLLLRSGAVSDTFKEQVVELNDRYGGDPTRLLDALRAREVSGFQTKKLEALEAYLRDENLLPEHDPLSPEACLAHALAASADDFAAAALAPTAFHALLTRIAT